MVLVLLYLDRNGQLADTACWRRRHASIKSRQRSPTGDERQNTRKSGPSPADSLKESQLAARSGPSPPRRTSPTTRIQTASLETAAVATGGRACDYWSCPAYDGGRYLPAFLPTAYGSR